MTVTGREHKTLHRDESQNVEYKESWHDKYLAWICGYANAQEPLQGGDRRCSQGFGLHFLRFGVREWRVDKYRHLDGRRVSYQAFAIVLHTLEGLRYDGWRDGT